MRLLDRNLWIRPYEPARLLLRVLHRSVQAIKKVLMDQKVLCGVGNIYANEALFLRPAIDPLQTAFKNQPGVPYSILFFGRSVASSKCHCFTGNNHSRLPNRQGRTGQLSARVAWFTAGSISPAGVCGHPISRNARHDAPHHGFFLLPVPRPE